MVKVWSKTIAQNAIKFLTFYFHSENAQNGATNSALFDFSYANASGTLN